MRAVVRTAPGTLERFMSKVKKLPSGCWEWQAHRLPSGHGQFWFNGKMRAAHRVAYELLVGPIPDGLDILHDCDNPPCVCPDPGHIKPGTHLENMQDRDRRGRRTAPRGEEHGMSKLTLSEVDEIKTMRRTGVKLRVIAKQFRICESMVSRIALGKNWV